MKYEEMLLLMDEYLNSDDLKDRKWVQIIQTCKRLLEKEIDARNNRRNVHNKEVYNYGKYEK